MPKVVGWLPPEKYKLRSLHTPPSEGWYKCRTNPKKSGINFTKFFYATTFGQYQLKIHFNMHCEYLTMNKYAIWYCNFYKKGNSSDPILEVERHFTFSTLLFFPHDPKYLDSFERAQSYFINYISSTSIPQSRLSKTKTITKTIKIPI